MTEAQAVMAMRIAIAQGKAKQFIETLWNGGTYTVNLDGQMIFVSEDDLKAALGGQ